MKIYPKSAFYTFTKTAISTCKDEQNSVDDGEEGPSEAAEKGHAGLDGLQPRNVRYIFNGFIRVDSNQPVQKSAYEHQKLINALS